MSSSQPRIAIVGSGPAGLTLAILLRTQNIHPVIFELRQQPTDGEFASPSGSLDLHEDSGLAAIRKCGLEEEFNKLTGDCSEAQRVADMNGAILHEDGGELSQRPEIPRHALIKLLVSHLPPASIRWGHKLLSATETQTPTGSKVDLDFGSHGKHSFDFVIGADGAWSQVRDMLTPLKPHYAEIQVITLTIRSLRTEYPQLDSLVGQGSFAALGLRHGVMSQRGPRGSARIYIFLTTPDEQAAVSLGLARGSASDAKKRLLENKMLLGLWGPKIKELVTVACNEEAMKNPGAAIDMRPLYTLPIGASWTHNPIATLVGDAAHLMCPWAGEGVNLAMRDSLLLADTIVDAVQSAKAKQVSFRLALSPRLMEFEQVQAQHAKEKASETECNGKMMFAEDGAKQFAQFFQSVYNHTNDTPSKTGDKMEEQGKLTGELEEQHEKISPKSMLSDTVNSDGIRSTVGELSRHASKAPQSQTEKPSSPPKRPVSRRKQDSNSNRQTQIAGEMKRTRLTGARTRSVKHPAKGLDDRGNAVASPNSTFWSPECERVFQVSISGGWPDVDWLLIDEQPKYRVATNTFAFRAICGQRFGAVAPPGEECTNCRDGHGPFETCRIACLPKAPSPNGKKVIPAKALFAGSCMGCGLTGAGNKCSLRDPPEPKWVREYFVKEIPELEFSIDLSRKLPLSPSPSTHGQEKKRQKLQTPSSEPPSPRMTNTTETPQQSAILSPTTQRVSSTFTSNSQGEVKFLPSSGPRYISPLNEAGVFQNLQSLDRVLSEARLASERAAFDVRLLARRRDELIQKVNEDTEGYENIGGFADLIEVVPDIKPEMEK